MSISRTALLTTILSVAPVACTDRNPQGPGDTGGDTDTDIDAIIAIEGDWEGTALSLHYAVPEVEHGIREDAWASFALTAGVLPVALEVPPEDDLVDIEEGALSGAYYLPALFLDDGDAERGDGEPFVGTSDYFLLYLQGAMPAELAEAGIVEGWNAIRFPADSDMPEIGDVMDVPLIASLWPTETLGFGGTYTGTEPVDGLGVVLYPYATMQGNEVEGVVYDGPLQESWSVTLEGEPPDDHLLASADPETWIAMELPAVFQDTDESGSYDFGEPTPYAGCLDDSVAWAVWSAPPTSINAAWTMGALGLGAGWWMGTVPADGEGLQSMTDDDAQRLTLGPECSVEGR